jgi:mono/diheme cytochrome c family protein
LLGMPANGQDVDRGRALTQSLCANCHIAARPEDQTGRSGVPTFSAIANRRDQTFDGVVRWLRSVPSVMPNHRLTQDEILDLAEFIMSLRTAP